MQNELLRFRKNVRYAFIDCETFNLNLSFLVNRPWQIAVIEIMGEEILETKDVRINWPDAPHLSIGKEAAIITRFDPQEHQRLAIGPKEAFEIIWPILERADYIIMHNGLRFDLYLLKEYAMMMGREWKWMVNKVIDTNCIARGVKMNIPYKPTDGSFLEYQYRMSEVRAKGVKTSQKALAVEFEIPFDENKLHEGCYDIGVLIQIWKKLKYMVEI